MNRAETILWNAVVWAALVCFNIGAFKLAEWLGYMTVAVSLFALGLLKAFAAHQKKHGGGK